MYDISATGQFKRDLKAAIKRRRDIDKLNRIVTALANGEALPPSNRDHLLGGDYKGYRECHIEPDWLLIYKIEEKILMLVLTRTGSHSDLF